MAQALEAFRVYHTMWESCPLANIVHWSAPSGNSMVNLLVVPQERLRVGDTVWVISASALHYDACRDINAEGIEAIEDG